MFEVVKSGSNQFGSWALVNYKVTDNYVINVIARTSIELAPGNYTNGILKEVHGLNKKKEPYTTYELLADSSESK